MEVDDILQISASKITTYEEYLNISCICEIVLTNLDTNEGYVVLNGLNVKNRHTIRPICEMDSLYIWLKYNHNVLYTVDYDSVINDIRSKCFEP